MAVTSPLPDLLDPWRAVDSGSVYAGRLPLSSLPRLCGVLLDKAGDVTFRIRFFRDEERRAVLHCNVAAALKLRCQRCLEAMDHHVGSSSLLALVSGIEEERQLPKRYDPLLVSGNPMRPRELIEDELLLALPQIPMHESDDCAASAPEPYRVRGPTSRASPFAVLAELEHEG